MKAIKVVMLLFVTIFLINTQTVSAEEQFVQVYDSDVNTISKSLESNGLATTFYEKGPRNSETCITPYYYSVNADKNIYILYNTNDTGYINNIIVSTYSSNDSLYKEVIRKICLVLGVENNVDVFYNIQRWSSINSQKANRWFLLHEEIENGERVTYIIAKIF